MALAFSIYMFEVCLLAHYTTLKGGNGGPRAVDDGEAVVHRDNREGEWGRNVLSALQRWWHMASMSG